MTSSPSPHAVEMQDIVIRFPGVLANDHVNLTLKQGEIHALLGENGAGKSTLMNVLAGLYKPASGTIKVHGEQVNFGSPKDAIAKGIGMVHQHFMLVPTQTVTENILLGLNEPRFFMNLPKYDQKILELQDQFGLRVDPTAYVWQLSVGEQQRIEILKTLYRGANILIMDEPTAVLAPQEIEETVDAIDGVRYCAAVGIDRGRAEGEQAYVFVEVRMKDDISEWGYELTLEIVNAIHNRLGIRPARVYLVKPRTIPKTHNGKIQHVKLRELYLEGALREQGLILYPEY